MALLYDDYVWRLFSAAYSLDVQLPKDLEWVDEFTWSKVQQNVTTTLTGALVVQESTQLKGRPITLAVPFDDMAWIQRDVCDELMRVRDEAGFTAKLQHVKYNSDTDTYSTILSSHDFEVMFRHYEQPVIDVQSVKRFDNFESGSWYRIRSLKFMEAISSATSPCTSNVTLVLSGITGTFVPSEIVTSSGGVSGTVISFSVSTLNLYVADGTINPGETITGPSGSATVSTVS